MAVNKNKALYNRDKNNKRNMDEKGWLKFESYVPNYVAVESYLGLPKFSFLEL